MEIVLIGLSHKTAPVETRERLAVLDEQIPGLFEALLKTRSVIECAVVSTCNRTELYAVGETPGRAADAVIAHLSARDGQPAEVILPHLYQSFNRDAVRHLFSVSAGLDSMILGEGQILAQVRKAHQISVDHGGAGTAMGKLFERAVRVGKRVRTETRISQGATSVSFAAVELARRIHGDLKRKRVLVVGTGEMGVLTLKLLISAGAEKITVLSRHEENARRLLDETPGVVDGVSGSLAALEEALNEADVVISATASPVPVITASQMKSVQRRRKYRSLFIVDIAVPRDVEPAVNDIDGVFLYNVDDLSSVVNDSLAERGREVDRVRAIIDEEVESFLHYCASLETVPVIKQVRAAFEASRQREVEALLARERFTDAERDRFESFSRSLIARLLHEPTVRLKDLAGSRNVHEGMLLLLEIFGAPAAPRESSEQTQPADFLRPASDDHVDIQEETAP
ncbi:MAG: glutamyl-tRNA reductase [Proteobacteria bacterium]|nr:glutamyl-tRNA reductase [Pseudomonadota bacterium]